MLTVRTPASVCCVIELTDLTKTYKMYGETLHKIHHQKKLIKTPPIIAYRQPPNPKRIPIHSKVSNTTTTLQGNSKCDEKRCQICNLIDTRPCLTLPGTTSIVKPGSFSCNSSNVVYLISCNKCFNGKGNYIDETSTKFRFRINNHKSSIRNNTPGHPVANHFNMNNHTANDIRCCILRGYIKSNKERQLCEQKLIVKYINDLNKDKSFFSNFRTLSYT